MSPVDKLNLAGIILTGSGSTVAMSGAYMQMNGYFAFKPGKLFEELWRILSSFLTRGVSAGRRRVVIAATLAKDREDRATSLIGFYCVLFGFFLQMIGSIVMVTALFHGGGQQGIPAGASPAAIAAPRPSILTGSDTRKEGQR
jgi:hypothetical protein